MIKLIISTLISFLIFNSIDACVNRFDGRTVVAAGDWNTPAPWYLRIFELIVFFSKFN